MWESGGNPAKCAGTEKEVDSDNIFPDRRCKRGFLSRMNKAARLNILLIPKLLLCLRGKSQNILQQFHILVTFPR